MRILIIDTNYTGFMTDFWNRHAGLESASYDHAWRALMDECFGTADYYSHNLRSLGHEAQEVIANDERLQKMWAAEHGLPLPAEPARWRLGRRGGLPWPRRVGTPGWVHAILKAQVEEFRPDVLYIQDINETETGFLREMKAAGRLIAGQIACPLGPVDLSPYDIIFTSFPHFVERFRALGHHSEYFRIGFEPRVLDRLTAAPLPPAAVDASFAGGLSAAHSERTKFLEAVAQVVPLDLWGYGSDTLEMASPLRSRHHGPAWALEMYRVLQNSRVTINFHIDVAQGHANNMRLYEATGVGALLLTDAKRNLGELFEVGSEVVAYNSAQECAELLAHYVEHEEERAAIASAGQKRTLSEHTYGLRMQELSGMLERYL